jgi:hypothetical protein
MRLGYPLTAAPKILTFDPAKLAEQAVYWDNYLRKTHLGLYAGLVEHSDGIQVSGCATGWACYKSVGLGGVEGVPITGQHVPST